MKWMLLVLGALLLSGCRGEVVEGTRGWNSLKRTVDTTYKNVCYFGEGESISCLPIRP